MMIAYRIVITFTIFISIRTAFTLNQIKVCTAENCPNTHPHPVDETVAGLNHKYARNVENGHRPSQGSQRASDASDDDNRIGARPDDNARPVKSGVLETYRHPLVSVSTGPSEEQSHLSGSGIQATEDGLYWSSVVEAAIPPGLTDAAVEDWSKNIRKQGVVQVEAGSTKKCGSDMNRHVIFEDGTSSCARYRYPAIHFVMGDVYCFHLARMLDMRNVPSVILSKVSTNDSSQWHDVTQELRAIGWTENTVASFSQWIDDIGRADLPKFLFDHQHSIITPSTPGLQNLTLTELVELAQYSDLIVFDYITGHLDRMTIRKDAVERYNTDAIYGGEVHNLCKHTENGGLWFLDNENGIFNSYSLLYRVDKTDSKYHRFHEELIRTMCVFRRSTVERVTELSQINDPYLFLHKTVYEREPLIKELENWSPPNFNSHFNKRIQSVFEWMQECKSYNANQLLG